jgi:ribonuclease HI
MDIWKDIVMWRDFHNVTFHWVKGHNDNKYNELADLYANISAIVLNPIEDVEF